MINKRQRIIITGGNGFIGTFITEKLLANGYENITVLDISHNQTISKVKNILCDISDKKILSEIIKKDDIVIHLACSCMPGISEINIKKDIEEYLIGTIALLDICTQKKIKKIIYLSSGGTVYGDKSKKSSKETDPTLPKNFYGSLKLSIEKYLEVYGYLYGLRYDILRLSNPYGRKNVSTKPQGVIDIFLEKILKDKVIELWGNGDIIRDYIHIDDVTDFIFQEINGDSPSGIYNLGTGKGATLNEIISTIEGVTGKKARIKKLPLRKIDIAHNVLDIQKARATGWTPKITLKKGIKDLYLKKNPN